MKKVIVEIDEDCFHEMIATEMKEWYDYFSSTGFKLPEDASECKKLAKVFKRIYNFYSIPEKHIKI
jgi:hypothetical protein